MLYMKVDAPLNNADYDIKSGKPKGLFVMHENMFDEVYGSQEINDIISMLDIYAPLQTEAMISANPEILRQADVIISGWGIPFFDAKLLKYAENLKAIFYGAGSVRPFVSRDLWDRGIRVSSAALANAVPVAEYTLGHILVGLKRCWYYAQKVRKERDFMPSICRVPGGYRSTVGLVSLGAIARMVCRHLDSFDIDVVCYDPYVLPDISGRFSVEMIGLDELFRVADIVSLHSPLTDETVGMITGEHFLSMKYGSTFINTARGAIVCEAEMIEALKIRPDITAVLDVTEPEPPRKYSALYDLPNVLLTPHIAGAMGTERRRLGRFVVDELNRYLNGAPLKGEVNEQMLAFIA